MHKAWGGIRQLSCRRGAPLLHACSCFSVQQLTSHSTVCALLMKSGCPDLADVGTLSWVQGGSA
eukprot:1854255-Amphidinium_carterae.1